MTVRSLIKDLLKNQTTTVDNDSLGVEDLVTGDGNTENPGLKFESVFHKKTQLALSGILLQLLTLIKLSSSLLPCRSLKR